MESNNDVPIQEDNTLILNRSTRKPRSKSWSSFEKVINDKGRQAGKCKTCGEEVLGDGRSGTSGLKRHILTCRGGGLLNYPVVEHSAHRKEVSYAVLRHNYPYKYVEHEGNMRVHKFLNPMVKSISTNTLRSDVLGIYEIQKEKLKMELEAVNGKICLTSDLWTSLTMDGYFCLTAHYTDLDWVLQKRILIFRHVPPRHNILGHLLVNFLQEWDMDRKVFTITLDNASYQDGMVKVLRDHLFFHDSLLGGGFFLHVRCGAHILNLILKHVLKAIDKSVDKVRESAKFVRSSESRKLKFADFCRVVGLNVTKHVRQDVPTKWNSTYLMLDSAISLCDADHKLQFVDNQYVHFPTAEEWVKVEEIAKFLRPFNDITTMFSGSLYPTANLYFPSVFKIEGLILKNLKSTDPVMHQMSTFMYEKFQKYWECYSLIFSLAIVLDPRFKLSYVRNVLSFLQKPTHEDMFEKVKETLFSLFEEYMNYTDSASMLATQDMIMGDGNQPLDDIDLEFDAHENECGMEEKKSQLKVYLDEASLPRNQNLDILDYWNSNSIKWPELSLMTKDVLSIPLTTVVSESSFSCGGRLIDKFRSRILPSNMEARICGNDWLYAKDYEDFDFDSEGDDEGGGISTDIRSLIARLSN